MSMPGVGMIATIRRRQAARLARSEQRRRPAAWPEAAPLLGESLYDTLVRLVEQSLGKAVAAWDPHAADYTVTPVETTHALTVPVAASVPRVLDVGCGPGELLRRLHDRGFQVEGLDREPESVRRASRYAPCWIGEGEELGQFFPPGEFEVIVLSHVLEYVPFPLPLLRALRAMAARVYIFAVLNPLRPARLVRALLGSGHPDHPTPLHCWGAPEFQTLLQQAGFRVTGWHGDRVTLQSGAGRLGAVLSHLAKPLETRLLPWLFPLLSSSLVCTCELAPEDPPS